MNRGGAGAVRWPHACWRPVAGVAAARWMRRGGCWVCGLMLGGAVGGWRRAASFRATQREEQRGWRGSYPAEADPARPRQPPGVGLHAARARGPHRLSCDPTRSGIRQRAAAPVPPSRALPRAGGTGVTSRRGPVVARSCNLLLSRWAGLARDSRPSRAAQRRPTAANGHRAGRRARRLRAAQRACQQHGGRAEHLLSTPRHLTHATVRRVPGDSEQARKTRAARPRPIGGLFIRRISAERPLVYPLRNRLRRGSRFGLAPA